MTNTSPQLIKKLLPPLPLITTCSAMNGPSTSLMTKPEFQEFSTEDTKEIVMVEVTLGFSAPEILLIYSIEELYLPFKKKDSL